MVIIVINGRMSQRRRGTEWIDVADLYASRDKTRFLVIALLAGELLTVLLYFMVSKRSMQAFLAAGSFSGLFLVLLLLQINSLRRIQENLRLRVSLRVRNSPQKDSGTPLYKMRKTEPVFERQNPSQTLLLSNGTGRDLPRTSGFGRSFDSDSSYRIRSSMQRHESGRDSVWTPRSSARASVFGSEHKPVTGSLRKELETELQWMEDSDSLYRSLGIMIKMDSWNSQVRCLIAQRMLAPIMTQIEDQMKKMKALVDEEIAKSNIPDWKKSQLRSNYRRSEFTLRYFRETYPNASSPVLSDQNQISEFLNIICNEESMQPYVIQRLKELGQSAYLQSFSASSGGEWEGLPWSSNMPTDAELVRLFFFATLKLRFNLNILEHHFLPHSEVRHLFAQGYVAPSHDPRFHRRRDPAVKTLAFVEMSHSHYCIAIEKSLIPHSIDLKSARTALIHSNPWVLLQVRPGSQNIFECIALFLYCVKSFCNGQLFSLNLNDLGIDIS